MDSITFENLIQEHLLTVMVVIFTIILIYHYIIEKETGLNLTRKYRNSIFEAQSKIFLNATQYLISGERDLAIKEFLNAVDLNRETIDTYFALGGLFRSNGEIDKAISIHRSLIARSNISETMRLRALNELALDFDKGGFLDKAIDTYKDVLKVNRDQPEVILALCRIYEDTKDWDEAYNYRMMLSKVGIENQSETISHILIEKARIFFQKGDFQKAKNILEEAYKFAPSLSARILELKLLLVSGNIDDAKGLVMEIINQHPMYTTFMFTSLEEIKDQSYLASTDYPNSLSLIKEFYLNSNDINNSNSPAIVLSKIRMLKERERLKEAYEILKNWMSKNPNQIEVLKPEFISLLIDVGESKEALKVTKDLISNLRGSKTKHYCSHCGYDSDEIFWRCPQCHNWETIQFRWKV